MTDQAPLIPFFACGQDSCRGWMDDVRYLVTLRGEVYCVDCWRRAGRPWPHEASSSADVEAARLAAVEKMLARGGADAHLVRKGLT